MSGLRQLTPVLYGVISGTLTATFLDYGGDDFIYWFPGALFGIFFAVHLSRVSGSEKPLITFLRSFLFVALSTLAYRAAVQVYIMADDVRLGFVPPFTLPGWAKGACSGFTGSLILAGSVWACTLRRPSLRQARITVLSGAALGILIAIPEFTVLGYEPGALILFLPWQTVVFLALARMLPKR